MAERGIVLAFYQDPDAAFAVLRDLRRRGFRRSASIKSAADDRLAIDDYDVAPLKAAMLGATGGLLLGLVFDFLLLKRNLAYAAVSPLLVLAVLLVAGAVLGWILAHILDFGVPDKLIERYSKWLARDETVIIAQAWPREMTRILDLLRRAEGSPPITFAFHPGVNLRSDMEGEIERREPLTTERLSLEAGRLAAALHSISGPAKRGRPITRSLRRCAAVLQEIERELADDVRMGQSVLLSAEWLLDNDYLIQGHVEDVLRNLPRRYYEELPVIASGPLAGQPRVYGIASELVSDTDARLDADNIRNFLQAYQSVAPLTIGELWAAPLMIRIRLVEWLRRFAVSVAERQREREMADFFANRLLTAARRDPDRLLSFLAELARAEHDPSPHLADQLVGNLYDEEAALAPVRDWLERKQGGTLTEVIHNEHRDQTVEQISLANAISSLRQLSQMDWRKVFESVSRVDAVLWTDPTATYARMDFASRDRYRHAVEEIARRSKQTDTKAEIQVAIAALEMAEAGEDDPRRHVGYYLVDQGREALEANVGAKPKLGMRIRRWALRHPALVYLGSISILTTALLAGLLTLAVRMGTGIGLLIALGILALLPASEVVIQVVNYLVTRLLPPRVLQKMWFDEGVPNDFRTLVVVPMMLLTPESIRDEVARLEIRYLANPDPNLLYSLLGDYADAPQQRMPEDVERLDVVIREIEALNDRYGAGKFFLFHRERKWSDTEQKWIGWERKRGKLEQLNRYLMGEADPEIDSMLRAGDAEALKGIRFVITLDSDTQLPRDMGRRLVETLAHPLNLPRLSPDGHCVLRGYTIIQPRVSASLPSANATLFSRLFTDSAGTDPYTHAVSDVYQDLFGEGSYHGKGIYDLRAFHSVLSGRFPEAHLLSHDLIEGAHVRVGLASDVELLDLFPPDYVVYAGRQHRWIRGDWQIIDWLLPTVPTPDGKRAPNPLSCIDRWKIFDNLRRSLLPVAVLALLIVAWLFAPSAALWTRFAGVVVLLPPLMGVLTLLTTRPQAGLKIGVELGRSLLRSLVLLALLPREAANALDAIARVFYRRLFSHRSLLEWETAQVAHQKSRNRRAQFLWYMAWIPLASIALSILVWWLDPKIEMLAVPFLSLWILSPLILSLLHTPARRQPLRNLTDDDRRRLRRLARQTWRFFDSFVGSNTNWLPPDNYQQFLQAEVAERTSPTNIGLWLLASTSACDLGYLTLDEMIDRHHATMLTLDKLERYEGHLLNWYDTKTLQPLMPRYVSMVDSGNLLGGLWALDQAYADLLSKPILDTAAMCGITDSLAVLQRRTSGDKPGEAIHDSHLRKLKQLCDDSVRSVEEIVRSIQEAEEPARALVENLHKSQKANESRIYWAEQVLKQIQSWKTLIDRYLPWYSILATPPEGGLVSLSTEAHEWRRQALSISPSLHALAAGDVPGLRAFVGLHRRIDEIPPLPERARDWLNRLAEAAARAQWLAGEQLARAHDVLAKTRALADGMNMRCLYNEDRRQFHVGYNVSDRRLDNSFYDLLASEARLGSFVAIARGELPTEHWWALGRPFGAAYSERPLLSWSGTMFEYLMPVLLTRTFDNSLLDQACRAAVACQIDYGRQRGVPWGISEAAYSALDSRQVYQYRAFGVPALSLKRVIGDELVVAPYATVLALAFAPAEAVENLKRLADIAGHGLSGGYGLYESIDYSRQLGPEGGRGVVVYTYMAHHQGMILTAINNAMNDNIMQRRFHSDRRVRAAESLLYERVPIAPPITRGTQRETPLPRLTSIERAPATGRVDRPDTPAPITHINSNGAYSVMVTNAGGGYSRWKDFEITRWRSDTTRDCWGTFIYIRDVESGNLWSAGHQPVCAETLNYTVLFAPEKSEIKRREYGIETITEVFVSPEDNAEIRRLTITNRSVRSRELELTSYAEIALAPHNTDRAHPAFSKLFVQTEALPEQSALLAWRRPRSADDPQVCAAHVIAVPVQFQNRQLEYETDRAKFLGRGRTPEHPVALERQLTNSAGAVLDPIFSLRRRITLEPGQRIQVAFVTAAGEKRDEVVALAEKYCDMRAVNRAVDMAWTQAQLELRHLRIQPDDVLRYQQLSGYILYPHAQLRPPPERIRRNMLGQTRLWAYGISGDLPILVVTIGDPGDIELVRQVLMAHTVWRARGLKVDLVILNEEAPSYEQPLNEQLKRLIHAQSTSEDQPGGVYLRPVSQLPPEDLTLLLSVARAVLVAARGPLAQQLGTPAQAALLPPPVAPPKPFREEPSAPLPFMELPYFNGLGGFTTDGREYAIYLGPGDDTPLPWVNVIANPSFGTMVSESGAGFSWYGNSQSNRLTPWSNDPVTDPVGDAIYIREDDLGVFWSPTAHPIREEDAYRARYGQGYSLFEHNSHAIEQELTTFVPMDDNGGAPVRVQRLRLRNRSSRRRTLIVTAYHEWVLGVEREDMQMHVVTNWDAETQSLFARNAYHPDFGSRIAFCACSPAPISYTGDRTEFIGRNGSLASPAAMRRTRLAGRCGAALDPCGALQTVVEIEPNQQAEVIFLLGQASDANEARTLIRRFRSGYEVEQALKTTRDWWENLLGALQVETSDLAVNFLLNRWLLYQNLSCRVWGRSAFYQSGGAFGFRDQLQDSMAFVHAAPHVTREQILRSASRQFVEGDVQHWWHPPSGAGVRTRISDDLLWLPFVTEHYVRITGDTGILDESVPFIEGSQLKEGEAEAFFVPTVSQEKAPLLEHCRRSIAKGLTAGPHGLPLIGGGDWNDGLNRVGIGGKGESVWLAWFLIAVLNGFAELLTLHGEEKAADEYRNKAAKLAQTVEEQAWDGEWYRRAYYDDGTPLGSKESEEAKIDSLPQSWSVICGMSDSARSEQALRSVWQNLVREKEKMVLLFTPPFDKTQHDPGYIKGYLPGVRENGGQYTHGSLWVPLAHARRGEGDRAVALLRMMNPVEHTRVPEDVERYKVEPYVVVADIYALEEQIGRGGWTWYTGSAGWMYRIWLEEVLGFKRHADRLTIDPSIAPEWDGFKIRYRFGGTWYEITVENPNHVGHGVVQVEMDGAPLTDNVIPLHDDGGVRQVRIVMGAVAPPSPTPATPARERAGQPGGA